MNGSHLSIAESTQKICDSAFVMYFFAIQNEKNGGPCTFENILEEGSCNYT